MKPNQLVLAMVLVLVVLVAACGVAKEEWVTFVSEAGNFTVHVPAALQESVNITDTPLGQMKAHAFVLERAAVRYKVSYTEYPVPGLSEAIPLGALEGAVIRTLDSLDASLISKNDIFLDEALGIEFRGDFLGDTDSGTPKVVYGRVYLANRRLYQLVVVASAGQVEAANPQRFLASFQWVKQVPQDNNSSQ